MSTEFDKTIDEWQMVRGKGERDDCTHALLRTLPLSPAFTLQFCSRTSASDPHQAAAKRGGGAKELVWCGFGFSAISLRGVYLCGEEGVEGDGGDGVDGVDGEDREGGTAVVGFGFADAEDGVEEGPHRSVLLNGFFTGLEDVDDLLGDEDAEADADEDEAGGVLLPWDVIDLGK